MTYLGVFHQLIATTYGSGVYGAGNYNGTLISIGPFSLPNTGAGWSVLIGAALVAIGSGVFVWLRQHSQQSNT